MLENKTQIIIVEDDENLLNILKNNLQFSLKTQCQIFNNPNNALKYIKKLQTPFILLSDIVLPDNSGINLCKQVRSLFEYKDAGIILFTQYLDSNTKLKAFDNGADDYINKPIIFIELISKIKALLNRLGDNNENTKSKLKIDLKAINKEGLKLENRILEYSNLEDKSDKCKNCKYNINKTILNNEKLENFKCLKSLKNKDSNKNLINKKIIITKKQSCILKSFLNSFPYFSSWTDLEEICNLYNLSYTKQSIIISIFRLNQIFLKNKIPFKIKNYYEFGYKLEKKDIDE